MTSRDPNAGAATTTRAIATRTIRSAPARRSAVTPWHPSRVRPASPPSGALRRETRPGPSVTRSSSRAAPPAARAFCSTRIIERPVSSNRVNASYTRPTTIGARPSDGSSSSKTRGLASTARAIASICISPPLSVLQSCASRSRRTGKNANIASSSSVCGPRLAGDDASQPRSRLSRTDKPGSRPRPSGTRAIPRRTRS